MNEIQFPSEQAGEFPIYAVLVRSDEQHLLAAGTLEPYAAGHWADYAIVMVPSADGQFLECSIPAAAPAGTYTVTLFEQAGDAPATDDTDIGAGSIDWRPNIPVNPSTNALLADAIASITGQGSELVTYTQDGVSRQIRVMVDRAGIVVNQQFAGHGLSILVVNDVTAGMTTVKPNKDTVTLPPRIGGQPKPYTVVDILPDSDPFTWHLQLNAR